MKHRLLGLAVFALIAVGALPCINAATASAKVAKAQNPKVVPRYKRLPTKYHEYYVTLEKEASRMMRYWLSAMEEYAAAAKLSTVFGRHKRRQARSKLRSTIRDAERNQERFRKAYDRFRDPIEQEERQLKERALKLSQKNNATEDPSINKRITELYDQAYKLGEQLNALNALQEVFYHISKTILDESDILGITGHDSTVKKVIRENPDLIEARLLIMDCQADIARLEKQKQEAEVDLQTRWSMRDESNLERAHEWLERAVEQLERAVDEAKKPFRRKAEKLKKRIDYTKEKIDDIEERGRNAIRHHRRLSAYDHDRQSALQAAALIDKLAQWKKPEQKK